MKELDTIREALRQAYGAGYCEGYKQKHVEPDWIDEGFVQWIDNAMGDNEVALAALYTIEAGSKIYEASTNQTSPVHVIGIADAKPQEPSEDAKELWATLLSVFYSECDYKNTQTKAAALITAHDDAIRRDCANRLEAWWRDEDTCIGMLLEENIVALRAAILGTEPAREES